MTYRFSCWCHLKWKPHPCGYYGDAKRECRCSTRQIETYRQKISGPLLDRIDIHCEVPLVDLSELSSNTNTREISAIIRKQVIAARGIQLERFKKSSNSTNSAMGSRQVRQHCQLSAESNGYLEHAMEEMNFSARAHDRILASWTGRGVFLGKERKSCQKSVQLENDHEIQDLALTIPHAFLRTFGKRRTVRIVENPNGRTMMSMRAK